MKEIDPFIVTDTFKPAYFCNRKQECNELVDSLINGKNIAIIAPRRMGKTALIHHCFDKSEIGQKYYTFFINILHTSNLREFTYLLCREVYEKLAVHNDKTIEQFAETLKSLLGRLKIEQRTPTPAFCLNIGDIDSPEITLRELSQYLETADKRCIIAINELQQVAKYEEKNVKELFRTHIQQMQKCQFVFAGSNRPIMAEAFTSPQWSFYKESDILYLEAITSEKYIPFVVARFKSGKRTISDENVEVVYNLFKGHTYYLQRTFNEAFAYTPEGKECTLDTIRAAIARLIAYNETYFREILSNTPEKQKELLYAIAKDGYAERVTSAEFIKRHSLTSASSIQSAANKLLEKELISDTDRVFSVTDKLLGMWINGIYDKNTLLI